MAVLHAWGSNPWLSHKEKLHWSINKYTNSATISNSTLAHEISMFCMAIAILTALWGLGDTATDRSLRDNQNTNTMLDQSCSSLQLYHRFKIGECWIAPMEGFISVGHWVFWQRDLIPLEAMALWKWYVNDALPLISVHQMLLKLTGSMMIICKTHLVTGCNSRECWIILLVRLRSACHWVWAMKGLNPLQKLGYWKWCLNGTLPPLDFCSSNNATSWISKCPYMKSTWLWGLWSHDLPISLTGQSQKCLNSIFKPLLSRRTVDSVHILYILCLSWLEDRRAAVHACPNCALDVLREWNRSQICNSVLRETSNYIRLLYA